MPQDKYSRYKSAAKFLWQTIKPHKELYIIASLIALMLVGTGLVQARVTQSLIDNTSDGSIESIYFSLLLFVALITINGTLTYISGICVSRLAAKSGCDLKNRIAHLLLHAKYGEIVKQQAGDTLQTIGADTGVVCDFIGGDLIGLFSQFSMALGVLIYVLFINPLLVLITFVYTPIGMFFTLSLNREMNKLYPMRAEGEGRALSTLEQVLATIPVIKSFIAEKQIREKLSREYNAVYKTDIKISKWNALMQTACSSTAMVPRVVYLIFAGHMVINGNLSVGTLLSVFDLLTYVIGPTVYLPFLLNGLNRSIASINRIAKLQELPQTGNTEQKEYRGVPHIKIDNISFSYNQGTPVISNLSFEHTGAGIVAICGKSGSGKTTLLDLIAGLYKPDNGNIEIHGAVSVVTQDTYLFNDTIIENVRIAKPSATDLQVFQALHYAGADNFAVENNDFTELSGGQKQRIALARTILADAPIWLLDEPTSALDSDTEKIVAETIKNVAKGKLIIISAHRQSLIDLAQRRIDL